MLHPYESALPRDCNGYFATDPQLPGPGHFLHARTLRPHVYFAKRYLVGFMRSPVRGDRRSGPGVLREEEL